MRSISSIQFSEMTEPEHGVYAKVIFSDGGEANFGFGYQMEFHDPGCTEDHAVAPQDALVRLIHAIADVVQEQDLLYVKSEGVDISRRTH